MKKKRKGKEMCEKDKKKKCMTKWMKKIKGKKWYRRKRMNDKINKENKEKMNDMKKWMKKEDKKGKMNDKYWRYSKNGTQKKKKEKCQKKKKEECF